MDQLLKSEHKKAPSEEGVIEVKRIESFVSRIS
jgi:hypothetical protein